MTLAANNPDRIIRDAMFEAGLLPRGQVPNGDDYARYLRRLTDMINVWQTQGLKLWLQEDQAVTLVAGQATYTLAPGGSVNMLKPLRVLQGYYLDSSSNRRPIDPPLSRDEYTRLSNVTQPGPITSYFVDKQATQLLVTFWMTPDTQAATGVAHLIIQRQINGPVMLTDTMDFPVEWFLALVWGLADDISSGQPLAVQERCTQRAMTYKTALEDFDVEDAATSFQPDSRMFQSTGGFR